MNTKNEINMFEVWKELFVSWNYLLKLTLTSWEYIFSISKLQRNTAENYKKIYSWYNKNI
ncbi:MAG: hypothetical protein ABFD50_11660 [Smithella sp.]